MSSVPYVKSFSRFIRVQLLLSLVFIPLLAGSSYWLYHRITADFSNQYSSQETQKLRKAVSELAHSASKLISQDGLNNPADLMDLPIVRESAFVMIFDERMNLITKRPVFLNDSGFAKVQRALVEGQNREEKHDFQNLSGYGNVSIYTSPIAAILKTGESSDKSRKMHMRSQALGYVLAAYPNKEMQIVTDSYEKVLLKNIMFFSTGIFAAFFLFVTALYFGLFSGIPRKDQGVTQIIKGEAEISSTGIQESKNAEKPAAQNAAVPAKLRTALVVDDNILEQKIIKTRLKSLGITSEAVSNSGAAIKKMGEKFFDVLLFDMPMSDINAVQAAEEITASIIPKGTKMIVMIPGMTASDEEKCLAAGMYACLPKPVKKEDLKKLLLG